MKIIVAVDKNWGIGKDGRLLARIADDLKFFKEKTIGNVIIMGRKTFESLPGSRALPGRDNIVITKNPEFNADGAELVMNIEQALSRAKEISGDRDIFVIGGASIYKAMLSYCDEAYVTKINSVFEADAFMENLDILPNWEMVSEGEMRECGGIEYQFCKYRNKKCEYCI